MGQWDEGQHTSQRDSNRANAVVYLPNQSADLVDDGDDSDGRQCAYDAGLLADVVMLVD